jgi:hypothetical protein
LIKLTAFRVPLLFSEALFEESRPPGEVAGELPEYGIPLQFALCAKMAHFIRYSPGMAQNRNASVQATEPLKATD